MRVFHDGLPNGEADRLAAIMAAALVDRERGWSATELSALAASPGVTVIAAPDGFALVRVVADEAEILTLAVRPEAQGRGHGRALLTAALSGVLTAARTETGPIRVFLEVGEANTPARRLYHRAGFAEVGRRGGYFRHADGSREDALVLERRQ